MRVILLISISFAGLFATHYSSKDMLHMMESYRITTQSKMQKTTSYYKNEMRLRYKELSKLVASKWGDKNIALSNRSTFIQYSPNLITRKSIDFKNGKIKLETIVSVANKSKKLQFFQKSLTSLLNETLSEALLNDPLQTPSRKIKSLSTKKIKDLISPKNIHIANNKIKERIVVIKNQRKKIISVEIPLTSDHMQKRVKLYLPLVKKYCKKYHLKVSYVLGTIKTESNFNPFAISKAPAYGLMQIVPTTAGVDSYFTLYGTRKVPSKEYLDDPENNIELGTLYMQIIRDRYLKGIKNTQSLKFCTTTAYNAGIRNVYKVFTNKSSQNAIYKINNMSSRQVYTKLHMSTKLTREAKNYIYLIQKNSRIFTLYDKTSF